MSERNRFEVIINAIKTGTPITSPRSRFEEIINAIVGAGGSSVSVTPIQTDGLNIATVTVDGVDSEIYAPDVVVTPVQLTGTKIAEITIDDAGYDIYAPAGGSPHFEVISKSTGLAYGNPVEVEPNSFTNDSVLCFEILGAMNYNLFCIGRLVSAGAFTIGCDSQGNNIWYQITFDSNTNTFTVTNNGTGAPAITNILAWK